MQIIFWRDFDGRKVVGKGSLIIIKTMAIDKTLIINDITHLINYGAFTKIYTIKGEVYNEQKLFKEYENQLNQVDFFKANNKTLININQVSNVCCKNRMLKMENGLEIKISRRNLYKFKTIN